MIVLYIICLSVAFILGYIFSGLLSMNPRQELETIIFEKRKRIDEQAETILATRKEMIEYKGAASSNELRADALQKMKDDLQKEFDGLKQCYDDLQSDYKMMFTDYKKLYIELDSIKAAEVRKFRSPEEIVKEMISEHTAKILFVLSPKAEVCDQCNGTGEVIAEEKIHSQTIDVPYKKCSGCGGTGIK